MYVKKVSIELWSESIASATCVLNRSSTSTSDITLSEKRNDKKERRHTFPNTKHKQTSARRCTMNYTLIYNLNLNVSVLICHSKIERRLRIFAKAQTVGC